MSNYKIGFNLSPKNITFNSNKISSSKISFSSAPAVTDTFSATDSIPAPVITDEQIKKNKITDEQINQMNKSKKLPPNAMLASIPKQYRGANYPYDSYKNRFHYEVRVNYLDRKNAKRTIPEGYVAARAEENKVVVVKAEDAEIKKQH